MDQEFYLLKQLECSQSNNGHFFSSSDSNAAAATTYQLYMSGQCSTPRQTPELYGTGPGSLSDIPHQQQWYSGAHPPHPNWYGSRPVQQTGLAQQRPEGIVGTKRPSVIDKNENYLDWTAVNVSDQLFKGWDQPNRLEDLMRKYSIENYDLDFR